jgi:hypothetical protein
VADERVGLEQNAIAGDPRAPAKVDVFQIGEEVFVERAELHHRRAPRDHVPAAREEEFVARARLLARAERVAEAVLECVAVEGHHSADEVDLRAGGIDDLPADGEHVLRRGIDGAHESREPTRLRNSVVVEEDDVRRGRSAQRSREAAGEAAILGEREQLHVRMT